MIKVGIKNLKTKGLYISEYKVSIETYKSEYADKEFDVVFVAIEVKNDRTYTFRIHNDDRHNDLKQIRQDIENEINYSIENKTKLLTSRQKERDYIWIEGLERRQYTGIQLT